MTQFCRACHRHIADDRDKCPRDGYILTPKAEDPFIGRTIGGRYELKDIVLGSEDSKIYLADNREKPGELALVHLYRQGRVVPELFDAFIEKWNSAGIEELAPVTIYGATEEGYYNLVIEQPAKRTALDLMDEKGVLDASTSLHIAIQLSRALSALHSKGLLHGNLMPSSLVLLDTPKVANKLLLTNFLPPYESLAAAGGAERAHEIVLSLTGPLYLSPERASGAPNDVPSEIYALGCLIYEFMTGLPPFIGDTDEAVLSKHKEAPTLAMRGAAPDLNIAGNIDDIVVSMLAKNPANRPQDAAAVEQLLLQAAHDSRIYLPETSTVGYRPDVFREEESLAPPPMPQATEGARESGETLKEEEEGTIELSKEDQEAIEQRIGGLKSHVMTVSVLVVILLVGAGALLLYPGSEEDHGPMWQKLAWSYKMSAADGDRKGGNLAGAEDGYKAALALTGGISDGGDRRIKTLRDLLAVYENEDKKSEAKDVREQIVEVDKKRMASLFSSADEDGKSVKSMELSIPEGSMSPETARSYADRFIAEARAEIARKHVVKAQSYLAKALEVEDRAAHGEGSVSAQQAVNELVERSGGRGDLAQIAALLSRSLEVSARGGDKGDKVKLERIRTLFNLASMEAKKKQFEKAEGKVEEALKLADTLKESQADMVRQSLSGYLELMKDAAPEREKSLSKRWSKRLK